MSPALTVVLNGAGAFAGAAAAHWVIRRLGPPAAGRRRRDARPWGERLDAPVPDPVIELLGNVRDRWGCGPEVGNPADCPCSKHVEARVAARNLADVKAGR